MHTIRTFSPITTLHVPPSVAEATLIQGRPSLELWFITNCHPLRGATRACILRVAAEAAEELAKLALVAKTQPRQRKITGRTVPSAHPTTDGVSSPA